MKKFGTRLISAVLAGCMMTSVLPVSAFAQGGGTGSETGGDPQQGEVIKEFPREGGIITEGGTYNLHEKYTGCLDLQLGPDGSAVVNVTDDVHSDVQHDQHAVLVLRTGKVTINNWDNHKFTITGPAGKGGRCYYNGFGGAKSETTINGGIYECSGGNYETLFNGSGTLRLNDVTSTSEGDNAVNNWTTTYINGGEYDSGVLTIYNRWPTSYIELDGNVRVHVDRGNALGNSGTAIIRNGTYTSEVYTTIYTDNGAKTFVYGGTFKNTNTEQLGKVFSNVGELTIDGAGVQIENVGETACAVENKGTLTFKNGTVTAPKGAAILNTSSTTDTDATISGGTIKDSKYGIQVSSGQVTLNDVTFSNNENDIYLMQGMKITIADSFTKRATIKVEDAVPDRRLTEGENEPGLNLVSNDPGFKVAYNETGKYYYLTPRTGYTVDAVHATAKDEKDVVIAPNDDIAKDTPVTLTADPAPDGQKFADWFVTVDGEVRNDLLNFPNEEDQTTATFIMPKGNVMVKAEYDPVDPVDPADPSGEVDPVLTGAIVTGAVLVGAYETGTGIYRLMNMQGLPLPSNRIELAELVWERAGKPEPQNMTDEDLYADIDADDTDAQKAAHWMVEQELMKFDEDNNKFHPCFPVSKLRVCLTWQNAKDKGLID